MEWRDEGLVVGVRRLGGRSARLNAALQPGNSRPRLAGPARRGPRRPQVRRGRPLPAVTAAVQPDRITR
jgi:hypothetical protein